jgi:plastocyanin
VQAHDRDGVFVFETTRTTVRPGALTVSFRNEDLDEHDLWLEGTAPLITPVRLSDPIPLHRDVTATVTVAVGAYRFFCSVPGHSSMSRALTVTN